VTLTHEPVRDEDINYVFSAVGECIPEKVVPNSYFLKHKFYLRNGKPDAKPIERILDKFEERTGITSRRYARDDQVASDLGAEALDTACKSSGIELESIDVVIGATDYFDIKYGESFIDTVPGTARKVLSKLGYDHSKGKIHALDMVGGCPGWLESVMSGGRRLRLDKNVNRVAVVAMETLSRISDPHDKDSLIYSDGAGAVIIDAVRGTEREGIIAYDSETITHFEASRRSVFRDITDTAEFLTMGPSNNPEYIHKHRKFLKMFGPNVAELAEEHVPEILAAVLEEAGWTPKEIALFLLHQANRDLDHRMACRAGVLEEDLGIRVPITINYLGNPSVATIPTLIATIAKKELTSDCGCTYSFKPRDKLAIASVGASMIVDAMTYQVPAQGLPYRY